MTRHPILAVMTTIAIVVGMSGCRARDTRPDRRALRPVSLPDLARTSESARAQLRGRHASLTRTLENPAATPAELGDAYGKMGMLLMAAEYREDAEACFRNARALAPADMRWPYYLGHLYKARGDTPASAAAFEQALELKSDDPATLVWLGMAYLDEGRPEAAEPLFSRALSLQPRSVAAQFGLGRAALARRDHAAAVGHLEQALSLDRDAAAVIHYPLAMAYRELGELQKAEAHLRQRGPGEIHPPDPLMQDVDALLESAVAYEVRGAKALDHRDWPAAVAYFRKGIALAPSEASLHHKLGTALFLSGDGRGASEQFEEALRLSPTFARAHYSLGVLMGSSGRPDKAIEHLTAAVRADPLYVEARLRLADVLRASGRPREALSHYDQVAKLDGREAEAFFGSAMTLADLRRYPEARDRLAEGMERYPDRIAFAHALVRLLAAAPDDRVRDGPGAMKAMEDLLRKEQRSMDLDEMMAMTLAALERYDEAASWQRQAIAAAEQAGRGDITKRLAATLSLYEHHKPCRTPWTEENQIYDLRSTIF